MVSPVVYRPINTFSHDIRPVPRSCLSRKTAFGPIRNTRISRVLQEVEITPQKTSRYVPLLPPRHVSWADLSDKNGMTHAFVVQFENTDDRNYYVEQDPAHLAFKKEIEPLVEKITVLDYVSGVF